MPARKEITTEQLPTGCIKCTSHCTDKTQGYVIVWFEGRSQGLHRYLYQQKYGKLPSNVVVRHKCDNRWCVNIEHLESGTQGDNVRDTVSRGRNNPPIGTRQHNCKLKPQQVLEIYEYKDAQCSANSVALKYGVNHRAVLDIWRQKSWKHITCKELNNE